MENYMAKAADAFLTGRPYGIRLDFKHKGFALFNYNMNELGNHLPGRLETLPLEDFDVEDLKAYNKYIYPLSLILNRNL